MEKAGYQPNKEKLDVTNPPQGGSGVSQPFRPVLTKTLDEYKKIMNTLVDENKNLKFTNGYVTCLGDHGILGLDDCLELLKYAADMVFRKKGWIK